MSGHALVVDNDRLCVELLADILRQEGYRVTTAQDGMEAVECVRQEPPDIVFLDLVMPRIDGDRLFHYLRGATRTAHVPIVIVSGTLAEDTRGILALEADAYVAKGPREALHQHILTTLRRLAQGAPEARQEILGLDRVVPRQKVQELVALRRYVQSLLAAMADGVVEVDGRGRVFYVSRAGLLMLGQPELELIGVPIRDLLGPDHRPALQEAVARFVSGTARHAAIFTAHYRGRVLELSLARIVAESPQGGFLMLLRDVTDLTRKIEELSSTNARLEAVDRMRSELLAMVSHDLHTPLTAIKGALDVLHQEGIGVELGCELLGIARQNVDRLFRLVSDTLDLARIESGAFGERRERFDVVAALRGAIERLRALAQEKHIAVTLEAPEQLAPIAADAVWMEQVFTNLLANGLKFTPASGRIAVRVEDLGSELLIRVEDSGVGIPAEHLDHIFDRFYRVPGPSGTEVDGAGLGLSICKAIVEGHGGRIWAESRVGSGSTFYVTIPRGTAGGKGS